MAFESLLSMITPAVHAKPDVGRVNPDGQYKREQQGKKQREQNGDGRAHPIPNTQGQITGKLIDTTA